MILGVGIDLVDVERIAKAMENPKFIERILTLKEKELLGTDPMRVAGRWAAKEAAYKALNIGSLQWKDVEILGEAKQRPTITITHPEFDASNTKLHLSISHEKGHATAVVIVEKI